MKRVHFGSGLMSGREDKENGHKKAKINESKLTSERMGDSERMDEAESESR